MVTLDDAVRAFRNVTGQKAVAVHLSVEEWSRNFVNGDEPIASDKKAGDGSTTWEQNTTAFWYVWRDDVVRRDMAWVRSVHPKAQTIEEWMRENHYTGDHDSTLLKGMEDGKRKIKPNFEYIAKTMG